MNSRVAAWGFLLLAAGLAAGQGGETKPAALVPPDKRAMPATPAESKRLIAQIDADRLALEESQRESPSPSRARTIQLLEEEIETIKRLENLRQEQAADVTRLDQASTAVDELAKRLAQAGKDEEPLPDPADANAEAKLAQERDATDDGGREAEKERAAAEAARENLRIKQDTVRRQVAPAKRALAESQSDLTEFETDSREAAQGGVGAEQARVMGEQVYVYRLRVAENQTRLDSLRLRAGDLADMLIDQKNHEVGLAEANQNRLEARRARIEGLAEKAAESRLDRGRAEHDSIQKTMDEVAPWAQPYWALKLKLAEIQLDLADVAKKKRALETRAGPGGELALLGEDAAAESRSFASVDAGNAGLEDVVPATTQALLQAIERREADLARVQAVQDEVRGLRKEAHERARAARGDSGPALSDAVDSARKSSAPPEGVEPAAGPEREAASASSWEKLKSSLKAVAASRAALVEGYEKSLASTATSLHQTRKWREQSLLKYRSALLWTRDPSEISGESIDRARRDIGAAPAAVAGATKTAAKSSVDWAGSAMRDGRVFDLVTVFGSFFLAVALLVVAHRKAAKRFAAIPTGGTQSLTLGKATSTLGTLVRHVEITALIAFAGVILPLLAGASRQTVAVCAAIFLPPFLINLARTLIDVLFGSGEGDRGVLGVPEALARVLSRTCILVLRVCAFFVPVAILLTVTGYRDRNPGIVELLWLVNSIGCYVVVLVVLLKPSGIGTLLRRKGKATGRTSFLPALFAAAYPVVIAAVLFLLILRSLSYRVAARYFLERFVVSAAWIAGAMIVRRWFLRILFGNEPRAASPPPELASDPQKYEAQGRRALIDRQKHAAATLIVFGPALFFVLEAWGLTGAGWDAAFNRPLRPISDTVTLGNALAAIVTAVLAFFVVRSARDMLRFVILPRTRLDTGVRYTIVTLTTYALVALSAIVILGGQLKVDAAVIGGFVAFLGLGLGFGLQEIVNNFFSGIILLVERPLKVGDTVSIGGTTGRVDRINMRSTMIMTAENTGVIVPNKDLISSAVTNWSAGTPTIRESVPLGIAYGSDTALFKTVVMETVHSHGLVLKQPAADLVFIGFGSSSMDFTLRYWIKLGTPGSKVKSDLYFALDAAFRKNGIDMPFPQQDVHIKSIDPRLVPPSAPEGLATRETAAGVGE